MRLLGSHQPADAQGAGGCVAHVQPLRHPSPFTLSTKQRDAEHRPRYPVLQEFRKIFQPYSCDLHRMNATHFSKCLAGQRIIIIGDSTMRQVFQSLACLLSEHVEDGYLMVTPSAGALRSASPGPSPCSATLASSLHLHWAWHLTYQ